MTEQFAQVPSMCPAPRSLPTSPENWLRRNKENDGKWSKNPMV